MNPYSLHLQKEIPPAGAGVRFNISSSAGCNNRYNSSIAVPVFLRANDFSMADYLYSFSSEQVLGYVDIRDTNNTPSAVYLNVCIRTYVCVCTVRSSAGNSGQIQALQAEWSYNYSSFVYTCNNPYLVYSWNLWNLNNKLPICHLWNANLSIYKLPVYNTTSDEADSKPLVLIFKSSALVYDRLYNIEYVRPGTVENIPGNLKLIYNCNKETKSKGNG